MERLTSPLQVVILLLLLPCVNAVALQLQLPVMPCLLYYISEIALRPATKHMRRCRGQLPLLHQLVLALLLLRRILVLLQRFRVQLLQLLLELLLVLQRRQRVSLNSPGPCRELWAMVPLLLLHQL